MDQLLVALDVDTVTKARTLADQLRGAIGGFKIGNQLFTDQKPALVEELASRDDHVFLDLKFHDIPTTITNAIRAATHHNIWIVNVHASDNSAMMKAAHNAANEETAQRSTPPPLVITITMLTNLNQATLAEIGLTTPIANQLEQLTALTEASNLDGVVASPQEIQTIRAQYGSTFAIVTPGIRGTGDQIGDQSRTLSTAEALAAGATYLVIDQPIIAAADPRAAAERIAADCHHLQTS